jgi:hypothetical protein
LSLSIPEISSIADIFSLRFAVSTEALGGLALAQAPVTWERLITSNER